MATGLASTCWIWALPLLLLLNASSILATLSADQIEDDLDRITDKVVKLRLTVIPVDVSSLDRAERGEGPIPLVIHALNEVVNLTTQETAAVEGIKLLDGAGSKKVTGAFSYLIREEEELLRLLTVKGEWLRVEGAEGAYQVVAPSVLKPLRQLEIAQDKYYSTLRPAFHDTDAARAEGYQYALHLDTRAAIRAWTVGDSLSQV